MPDEFWNNFDKAMGVDREESTQDKASAPEKSNEAKESESFSEFVDRGLDEEAPSGDTTDQTEMVEPDEGFLDSLANIGQTLLGADSGPSEERRKELYKSYTKGLHKNLRNTEKLRDLQESSEKGLEQAWNPVTVFSTIFTGAGLAGMKVGGQALKTAMGTGLREAAVGTTADIPIHLAGEKLREDYGWGPGLLGELALSFASAATVENFVVRKLTSLGKEVSSLDDFAEMASRSSEEQQAFADQVGKLLDVSDDRTSIVTPKVSELDVGRPVSLKDLNNIAQITSKSAKVQQDAAEAVTFDTIRKADGKAYKSEKSARQAITRKGLKDAKVQKISDGYVIQKPRFQEEQVADQTIKEFSVSSGYLTENPKVATTLKNRDKIAFKRAGYRRLQESEESVADDFTTDAQTDQVKQMARAEYVKDSDKDPLDILLSEENGINQDDIAKTITEEDKFIGDMTQISDEFRLKEVPRGGAAKPKEAPTGEETPVTRDLDELEEPSQEELAKLESEQADLELVSEEELLKYADELGIERKTPDGVQEQINAQAKAQDDIEEFLGEGMENFSKGQVRSGMYDEMGFEDDVYYATEEISDPENILGGEDSMRDLGDFFKDLNNVIGGKVGLSLDDVGKHADRDSIESAARLMKDLKNHRSEAVRAGLDLADYYKQKGFNADVAQKLKDYNDLLLARTEEEASKVLDNGNIDEKLYNAFRGPLPLFSIEVPFRRVGAPGTGHALKTQQSRVALYEDEGKKLIKDLSSRFKHFDSEDWGRVTMRAEDRNFDLGDISPGRAEDIEEAAKTVRSYFDKSFEDLNNVGVLERSFPESFINRQEKRLAKAEEKIKTAKQPATKQKYQKIAQEAQNNIDYAKNIEYVPALSWLEEQATRDPSRFSRTIKLLNQKSRNVPSIRFLKDNDYVDFDTLDVRNIIGQYARRKGKDIANQELKNALLKDGLVRELPKGRRPKDFPDHWPKVDESLMPMLKNHVAHPRVADFLKDYFSSVGKYTPFERGMTSIKMAQFFNPVIMPMYDTYQTAVLHGLNSWRIPGHIKDGVKSVMKQDQDFRDLSYYGGYSKPFESSLGSWKDDVENAKLPGGRRFKDFLDPSPWNAIKNFYQLTWDTAWAGDRMIRMASYKELLRRGMGKKQASQMTALFHGDYASVPPGTRRTLNRILFTPTFKIVMTKWQASMFGAATESGERMARKSMPGVPNKSIGLKRRMLAGGLFSLAAANAGKHMLMTNLGFESDEWGRKYTQTVETDKGPKEIVMTFSDPTNILLKYMHKAYQATQPGGDPFMTGMFESIKYDIHPAWRIIGLEISRNQKMGGDQIYSPGDNTAVKALKSARYFLEESVPLLDKTEKGVFSAIGKGEWAETKQEREERELIEDQFGKIGKKLLGAMTFTYVRSPKEQQLKFRLNKVKEQIRNDMREKRLTPERIQNYREQIDSIREELEQELSED